MFKREFPGEACQDVATPSPAPSFSNLFKACASVPPFLRYRGICMENSVNVYIHTFISIYIYMYIYWYNWYTILSNPHKHCVSERATFSKSLVQCTTRLVHPPWLTTPNRTNLSSLIFHFSSPSYMYHFRYLPGGTLFCPFFSLFALSAPSILNKLQTVLSALADVLSPTCVAGSGTVIALSVHAQVLAVWSGSLSWWWGPFWGKFGERGIPRQIQIRKLPTHLPGGYIFVRSVGPSFDSVDVH